MRFQFFKIKPQTMQRHQDVRKVISKERVVEVLYTSTDYQLNFTKEIILWRINNEQQKD